MIIKINNKDKKFYSYMGKFFGSRIVQNETKDRIYDDDYKTWYISLDNDKVISFLSISNNVIKNIYSMDDNSLKELITELKKDITIGPSIITNTYRDIYISCGLKVDDLDNYKHFVTVRGEK